MNVFLNTQIATLMSTVTGFLNPSTNRTWKWRKHKRICTKPYLGALMYGNGADIIVKTLIQKTKGKVSNNS